MATRLTYDEIDALLTAVGNALAQGQQLDGFSPGPELDRMLFLMRSAQRKLWDRAARQVQ